MSFKSKIAHLSQKYLSQLTCEICNDIYDDPVVLRCCGKYCCKSCTQESIEKGRTCPYDSGHGVNSNIFRKAPKELFDKLDKLKVKCDYQKYGCNEILSRSNFDNHLKRCPFITCEICELRKQFGSEHNCVQELRDQNNDLKYENKRMSDENKLFSDKNIKMSEINSKLKTNIRALKETNVKLENEIKISNGNDIKTMDPEIYSQNGIMETNTQNNEQTIIQAIFQYSLQFILFVFNTSRDTVIGKQNKIQITRSDNKSFIESNPQLVEECLKLKAIINKLNEKIDILSKKENHNKSIASKLNLDLIVARNKLYERKIKLDIIKKENQELKSKLNMLTEELENIKGNDSEKSYIQTLFAGIWQLTIILAKLIKLIVFPFFLLETMEIVINYQFSKSWWYQNDFINLLIHILELILIGIVFWKFWGPPKWNDYYNMHRLITKNTPSLQRRR